MCIKKYILPLQILIGICVVIGVMTTTIILYTTQESSNEEFDDNEFEAIKESIARILSNTFPSKVSNLRIIGADFYNKTVSEYNQFDQLSPIRQDPTTQAVQYVPRIRDADREAFEAQASAHYNTSLRITDIAGNPVPQKPTYYPIYFTYPVEPNRDAILFDISTFPSRNGTINQILSQDAFVLSEPIIIIQDLDHQAQKSVVLLGPSHTGSQDLVGAVYRMVPLVSAELAEYAHFDVSVQLIYAGEAFVNIKTSIRDLTWIDLGFKPIDSVPSDAITIRALQANWSLVVYRGSQFGHNDSTSLAIVIVNSLLCGILIVMMLIGTYYYYKYAKYRLHRSEIAMNDQKWDFMNFICHEIRVPFQTIDVGITNIKAGDLDDKSEETFNRVSRAVKSASHILNEFLQFSKISQNKLSVSKDYWKLGDVLDNVGYIFGAMAKAKGVELSIKGPEHAFVYADKFRIEEVINNFVSNAIKYTDKGEVEVVADVREGQFQVRVRDTGFGIHQSDFYRVFVPYEQINVDKASQVGTGLGLVISKHIIEELHGGTIGFESIWEVGSTFWFSIPTKDPDLAQEVKKKENIIVDNGCSKKILIVDDSSDNRFVFETLLTRNNHVVHQASNGNIALDIVAKHKGDFDLILMDNHMPVMSGVEATKHIKYRYPNIRIWGITGNPEDSNSKWKAAGIDEVYGKPVNIKVLLNNIKNISNEKLSDDSSDDSILEFQRMGGFRVNFPFNK